MNRDTQKRLLRVEECGACITVTPNKLHGTLLLKNEMRDNLCLCYGIRPPQPVGLLQCLREEIFN